MLEARIIKAPTNYHLPYIAPTIFINKQLPPPVKIRSFQVVHNYRDINAATRPSGYPYHNIEADQDSMYCRVPQIHSQTDASNGF